MSRFLTSFYDMPLDFVHIDSSNECWLRISFILFLGCIASLLGLLLSKSSFTLKTRNFHYSSKALAIPSCRKYWSPLCHCIILKRINKAVKKLNIQMHQKQLVGVVVVVFGILAFNLQIVSVESLTIWKHQCHTFWKTGLLFSTCETILTI